MPNWKKVITSGSNAILNEITASGVISASTYYGDGSNLTGISGGSTDTGSLLTTASVSSNTITFTKGDSSTFDITVDTGSAGSDPFPYTGSAIITGSLEVIGDITTNTLFNVLTTLASDTATNVDTFATATYTGAIYDYILVDATVGARAGQFMVAHDNGNITFTDTSTKHLTDSPIPEITAQINGSNAEVQVTNGNGYTFKSFVKRL